MVISEEIKKQYKPTIGIECHVQLKTKTKLFAAVGNDAKDAPPNTLISHICVGLPGALPVLNEIAIKLSARAAFALGTGPQKFTRFERKHYFYPDLPKGYQITQLEEPIIKGGYVNIEINGQTKKINTERANLEEDAGKNTHPPGADYTLVDLNRAGTPLLEIVSAPDINSPAEAKAYAREVWLLMKYARVTDGDLFQGHLRFDVNVSVSKDGKLGTRSEIKNLNSFRSVENAVAYEIDRQIELLEKGGKVIQETRGWDETKQKSLSQRRKEEAEDYRYMPEPDIPPIELEQEYINRLKDEMPRLPNEWRKILNKLSISQQDAETLLDAASGNLGYLRQIDQASKVDNEFAKFVANTTINIVVPTERSLEEKGKNLSDSDRVKLYRALFTLVSEDKLNSNTAKQLLRELLEMEILPVSVEKYAEEKGYLQVSDEAEVEKIVTEILAENPKAAEDVKNGEMKAIGFLVGKIMEKSQGRVNPTLAQEIIKKRVGI